MDTPKTPLITHNEYDNAGASSCGSSPLKLGAKLWRYTNKEPQQSGFITSKLRLCKSIVNDEAYRSVLTHLSQLRQQ